MGSWPSNWQARTLDAAGVPVTPKALKVMSAWRASTPLQPWTNNPLGMPVGTGHKLTVPMTSYALFGSMEKFYEAFGTFSTTQAGKMLVSGIVSDRGFGPIWRMVSDLNWPGGKTETDYPSAVLDLADQSYRDSVNATHAGSRKTSGLPKASAQTQAVMAAQARSITQAAASFDNSRAAVQFLIRRHASNGY